MSIILLIFADDLKTDILLVGISYDQETKVHSCQIETFKKEHTIQ